MVTSATGCIPPDPPLVGDYTVAAGDVTGLIVAIDASNADPDPDIIAQEEGTYTLAAANNTGYGPNDLPTITTPIIFHANCATIERDPSAEAFRFFQVAAPGSLILYDLSLTGGDGGAANGGAIYSQGTVTATNTTIANSTVPGGGSIRNSSGIGHKKRISRVTDGGYLEIVVWVNWPRVGLEPIARRTASRALLCAPWHCSRVRGRISSAMVGNPLSLRGLLEAENPFDHAPILGLFPPNHVAAEGSMPVSM